MVSPPGTSTPVVEFIKAVLISVLDASGVLLVFSGVGDESKKYNSHKSAVIVIVE